MECDKIVEKYLLIQNPLYTFSFPISILIAIIVFGIAKAYNWSDNSYINQLLIPIVVLLMSMVILDLVSRLMINKNDKLRLTQLCKIWLHDPRIKGNPNLKNKINMEEVQKYKVESFTDNKEIPEEFNKANKSPNMMNVQNNILPEALIDEIPNVSPFPLDSKPNGSMCIQNSNGCNLCSGSNQNPDNIVSPIPGPQWMPQSAEYVQNRLMNNNYSQSVCLIK